MEDTSKQEHAIKDLYIKIKCLQKNNNNKIKSPFDLVEFVWI